MPRLLIVYASTHGHTATIAERIADSLRDSGAGVEVVEVSRAGDLDVRAFDGVVVGASVHAGRHQAEAINWVRHHAITLRHRPSALFSVSLTAAEDGEGAHAAVRALLDDFEDDTGWTPTLRAAFAGALQYREYDPFTRLLMRLKMAHGHHPTDVSVDHDFTDWTAVEDFAARVAELAAVPA